MECLREGRRVAAELATSSRQPPGLSGTTESKGGQEGTRTHSSDGRNTAALGDGDVTGDLLTELLEHVFFVRQQRRRLLAKWDQKYGLIGIATGKSASINHIWWIGFEKKKK